MSKTTNTPENVPSAESKKEVLLFVGYIGWINTSQYNFGNFVVRFDYYPSMDFIKSHIRKQKCLNQVIVLSISEISEEKLLLLFPASNIK